MSRDAYVPGKSTIVSPGKALPTATRILMRGSCSVPEAFTEPKLDTKISRPEECATRSDNIMPKMTFDLLVVRKMRFRYRGGRNDAKSEKSSAAAQEFCRCGRSRFELRNQIEKNYY
jgi:hypothetical protein